MAMTLIMGDLTKISDFSHGLCVQLINAPHSGMIPLSQFNLQSYPNERVLPSMHSGSSTLWKGNNLLPQKEEGGREISKTEETRRKYSRE